MKDQRIVFRHRSKTVECWSTDGKWSCAVQGEKNPRGPFRSPGAAVQEGIEVAEKHSQIKRRMGAPKLSDILRKASR